VEAVGDANRPVLAVMPESAFAVNARRLRMWATQAAVRIWLTAQQL
jgi:hypothetical protein